jgi:acyl-CoA thioester hydrolase
VHILSRSKLDRSRKSNILSTINLQNLDSMSSTPRSMLVELDLPIRTYDIDFAGIVSNLVYVRWLEDLRLTMLAQHYIPLPDLLLTGIAPILTNTEINYQRQLTIQDCAIGRMWIEELGTLRCILAAEILNGEHSAAQAKQTILFISLTTRRPVRIPADFITNTQ